MNYKKLGVKKYYEALGKIYKNLYKTGMRILEEKILLNNLSNSEIILDLGCGDGYHFYKIARFGKVLGLDISKTLLEEFKKKSICILADAEHIPLRNCSVDIVVSIFGALNHCNVLKAFEEIHRILKNNGILIFTVANKYNIFYILNNIRRFELRKIIKSMRKGEGYIYRNILGKRYKVWTKFLSLFEIVIMLKRVGFKILRIYGLNKNGIFLFAPLSIFSEYIGIVCKKV